MGVRLLLLLWDAVGSLWSLVGCGGQPGPCLRLCGAPSWCRLLPPWQQVVIKYMHKSTHTHCV